MKIPFVPTHQISFQPFTGPIEVTLVMLLKGDVWTESEWDALAPGQEWTHDHEWVIEEGEWWWALNGLCHTPRNLSGEIRIEPIRP